MALSTTFTDCAPATTKFGIKKQMKTISPFKVIQGLRLWYQWKVHIRLPISDYYLLTSYLAPFRRYSIPNLAFIPLDGGVPLGPSRYNFPWMSLNGQGTKRRSKIA